MYTPLYYFLIVAIEYSHGLLSNVGAIRAIGFAWSSLLVTSPQLSSFLNIDDKNISQKLVQDSHLSPQLLSALPLLMFS